MIRSLAWLLIFSLSLCGSAWAQVGFVDPIVVEVEAGKFAPLKVDFPAKIVALSPTKPASLEGRLVETKEGWALTLGGGVTRASLLFVGPAGDDGLPQLVQIDATLKGTPEPPKPDPPGPDPEPDPDPQPTPDQVGYALVIYESAELPQHPNVAALLQSDFLQRVTAAGGKARFYDDDHPGSGAAYREALVVRGVSGPGVLHYSRDGKTIVEAFSIEGMDEAAILARLGVK